MATIDEQTKKNAEQIGENAKAISDLAKLQREHTDAIGNLTRILGLHTDDIGDLKGMIMESTSRRYAPAIASKMGFEWVKTLSEGEVDTIAANAERAGHAEGISREDMEAFRLSDIIIDVRTHPSEGGEYRYVAVEVSFTGDARDTNRVVSHARYLTRFTGTPAHVAIASVRNVREIEDLVTEVQQGPVGQKGIASVYWWKAPDPRPDTAGRRTSEPWPEPR